MARVLDPVQTAVRTASRIEEARPIVRALTKELELIEVRQPQAAKFIEDMATRLAVDPDPIMTEKQIEWLRNLSTQYVGDIPSVEPKVSWKR